MRRWAACYVLVPENVARLGFPMGREAFRVGVGSRYLERVDYSTLTSSTGEIKYLVVVYVFIYGISERVSSCLSQ